MSTAVATEVHRKTWAAAFFENGERLGVDSNDPDLFADIGVVARASTNARHLIELNGIERAGDVGCARPAKGRDHDTLVVGQHVEALILDPLRIRGIFRGFADFSAADKDEKLLTFELPGGVMLQVTNTVTQIIAEPEK